MKILLYSSMLLIFQKTTQGLLSRVMSRRTHSSHSALLLSPYSLLLDTPIQLRDITEIANRYDIFLFDQFGVLHDGMKPLPGALRTLEFLKQSNKTVAIVSNTSSREEKAGEKLRQLGFPSSLYDGGVITSGECAYKFISSRKEMKSCLWFTWKEYKGNPFIDGLDLHLSDIHHADFILFQGTEVLVGSSPSDVELGTFKDGMIDTFVEEILRIGVRRGIPAVCANMDLKAVTQEGVAYMPGVLMREYALLGGECVSFGKPFSVHFEAAILQAEKRHRQKYTIPASQKLRCIHIGDSIEHDIKGAADMRIDSILITDHGVHHDRLHSKHSLSSTGDGMCDDGNLIRANNNDGKPLLIRVCDLCDVLQSPRPTYILPNFQTTT